MSKDNIKIQNDSKERVAFDLTKFIIKSCDDNYKTEKDIITLYSKCLDATIGVNVYKGTEFSQEKYP